MLSRTADHLYWMARYTERAENLSRMLDVALRMSLLNDSSSRQTAAVQDSSGWAALLAITDVEELYHQQYDSINAANVIRFMCFDTRYHSSIVNCLKAARTNAHAVRGTLTAELWETINATWIKMRDTDESLLNSDTGASELFDWVKFRSNLAHGVMQGTMLHDDALWFAGLGSAIERADNTARILDVKYHIMLPASDVGVGVDDFYQWSALLSSVASLEMYRKVYREQITPFKVAELLVLRHDMPRSLHRCMDIIVNLLAQVRNNASGETERRAGKLYAQLHYARMEDIYQRGLHDFLETFIEQVNEIGSRIADDFLIADRF